MRLPDYPTLPQNPDTPYAVELNRVLFGLLQKTFQKVNQLADGRISGVDLTAVAVPTTGTYAQGDFVRNKTPTELGTAASKYVILGWICTVGGTPGTFVQARVLTGN